MRYELTYNGVTKSLQEWADSQGLRYETLKSRLYRWVSAHRCLTEPVREHLARRRRQLI